MKTIIRNTASSILLITLVIIVIAANSTYTIHTLDELALLERRLFTTNQVINSINTLHLAVLRTESGQRGYLLADREAYLDDYEETLNKVNNIIEQVEANAIRSDFTEQEVRLQQLVDLSKAKLSELIETVELARQGRKDEAITIFQSDLGLELYNEFENVFEQIATEEHKVQKQHIDSLLKLRSDSVTNLIISSLTTGLLVISIFMLLRMNIRETIRHRRELQQHNLVL
ncbi:MAG: CHASE3 domain-containing protein, partial [Pseudomonadota bacterium]|nr:CHASE3 domain-containing protein [Pseudomonadota bacterium]